MRKTRTLLFLAFVVTTFMAYSQQQMNLQQTIDYINSKTNVEISIDMRDSLDTKVYFKIELKEYPLAKATLDIEAVTQFKYTVMDDATVILTLSSDKFISYIKKAYSRFNRDYITDPDCSKCLPPKLTKDDICYRERPSTHPYSFTCDARSKYFNFRISDNTAYTAQKVTNALEYLAQLLQDRKDKKLQKQENELQKRKENVHSRPQYDNDPFAPQNYNK